MIIRNFMYLASKILIETYTRMMINLDVIWQAPLPKGPRIIAANHPATSDPVFVAILNKKPSHILINQDLFNLPVLRKYLHLSEHIPVIRGRGKEAIAEAKRVLGEGRTVVIFPEGAISPAEGGFCEPRTGVARLAMETGAPVIPAGVYVPQNDLSEFTATDMTGKSLPATWLFKGRYNVTFGQPMQLEGSTTDWDLTRRNAEKVMDEIKELSLVSKKRLLLGSLHRRQPAFQRKRIANPLLPLLFDLE